MVKKGHVEIDLSMNDFNQMVRKLKASDKPRLADVLKTYEGVLARDGAIEIGQKMWGQIEEQIDLVQQRAVVDYEAGSDLVDTDFLESAGMTVLKLNTDDPLVEIPWTPPHIIEEGEVEEIQTAADKELTDHIFPLCQCGCDDRTKGGRFIPGHDAKLKSTLMRTLYYNEPFEAGEQAKLELQMRGWFKFYPAFARNEDRRARRAKTVKCNICGRPLVDEESVQRGIGPVCAGRHEGGE